MAIGASDDVSHRESFLRDESSSWGIVERRWDDGSRKLAFPPVSIFALIKFGIGVRKLCKSSSLSPFPPPRAQSYFVNSRTPLALDPRAYEFRSAVNFSASSLAENE